MSEKPQTEPVLTGGLPPFSQRETDGTVPFRVRGGDLATVEFDLNPGDTVYAEPGTLVCASGGVKLDVEWGTGLLDPLRRVWSGEKATLQEISAETSGGRVVIGAALPGRIVHVRLDGKRSVFCDRGAYLAHTGDIGISIGFTRKVRAGLFGGNGFMMQRLTGRGDVFLHALGSVIDWTLEPEAVALVNRRNLLAFEDTASYDIQFTGGPFTQIFGGQGLFLVRLQGPGRVISHSIDLMGLTRALRVKDAGIKELKGKTPASPQE